MRWKANLNKMFLLLIAVVVLTFALWGPEYLSEYRDQKTLNQVTLEDAAPVGEGYRYTLGNNEKLSILSKCLNSQSTLQSELSAQTHVESEKVQYEELSGTYAFVVNRQGPTGGEITEEEIYGICSRELAELVDRQILPDAVKEVTASSYSAVLYSAIDVLEPRNNVSVWKVSLDTGKQNADKSGRMLDAYIDADTGKIYELYVRIESGWEELSPDDMAFAWADYMGISGMEKYQSDNPLLENTPYYEKYKVPGIDESSTVITLGFYEGINELYLKISK